MASILNVDKIRANGSTTDALTIDSSGRVLRPVIPAFHAKSSANVYKTVAEIVEYDTVTGTGCFNEGGHFSTTTHKFTAPVDGLYSFAAQLYSNNQVAANMHWYLNDDAVASSYVNGTDDASAYEGIEMSVLLKLTANDTVYIKSASSGYHLNSSYSYFCGYLVG